MINYPVDLREIIENVGLSIDIDADFELGVLTVGEETFEPTGPAHAQVSISNVGSGIAAFGTVTATLKASCARCLCDFTTRLEGEVEGLYLLPGQIADSAEEAQPVDANGCIDIGPALQAALVFAVPFVPLHDEECAGLCAQCGADLNVESCRCHEEPAEDHPFAQLKELLGESVDGDS